jgi:hypothetical protein
MPNPVQSVRPKNSVLIRTLKHLLEKLKITDLTGLVHRIFLRTEPLPIVERQHLLHRSVTLQVHQYCHNGCSSPSLSVVAVHRYNILRVFIQKLIHEIADLEHSGQQGCLVIVPLILLDSPIERVTVIAAIADVDNVVTVLMPFIYVF